MSTPNSSTKDAAPPANPLPVAPMPRLVLRTPGGGQPVIPLSDVTGQPVPVGLPGGQPADFQPGPLPVVPPDLVPRPFPVPNGPLPPGPQPVPALPPVPVVPPGNYSLDGWTLEVP